MNFSYIRWFWLVLLCVPMWSNGQGVFELPVPPVTPPLFQLPSYQHIPSVRPILDRSHEMVNPSDWDYQALMALHKSGALVDMHGIVLGTTSYTRGELLPLIVDVVHRRETMNQSDQMRALRLYQEYRDEIVAYDDNARRNAGEVRPLTQEQINEKMRNFHIERVGV